MITYEVVQPSRPRRPGGRNLFIRTVFVLGVAAAAVAGPAHLAGASCDGPKLTVAPSRGPTGGVIEISGEYFGTDCNDTGGGGRLLGAPARNIGLEVVQGGRVVPLVAVDADRDYRFAVRLALPSDLQPGPATIRANAGLAVEQAFTVTVLGNQVPSSPTFLAGYLGGTAPPADASGTSRWILIVPVLLVAAAVVVVLRTRRRRSRSVPPTHQ